MVPGDNLNEVIEWASYFPTQNHAPLDRLAASAFVAAANPGGRLMAMFAAYFDASGTEDQRFMVVSGYIANYLQWKLLDSTWKKIHKDYGVDLPFHASDLMAATSNPKYKYQRNARKDYVALATDMQKATDFFKNIAIAELTIINCAVTAILPMEIYNDISSLLDLRTKIPPYALAARSCIDLVRTWERTFDIREPVECIFEEGDFGQGKFTELMIDEGQPIPIYKKKAEFVGLQAADHYAWERAFFSKRIEGTEHPPRLSFQMLVDAIPKLHMQSTQEHLINVCRIKGIDPRTGVKHDK